MTETGNPLQMDHDHEILQRAHQLFAKKPDWVTFFREILGVSGAVRRRYKTPEEVTPFRQTSAYAKIQRMLDKLREKAAPLVSEEPNRVITVRLPKSLHDLLREEAYEHRTSINKLCISKLLRIIDKQPEPDKK